MSNRAFAAPRYRSSGAYRTTARARAHVIYQELCLGVVKAEAKADYLAIIEALAERGAQGVILGCTEIPLAFTKYTDGRYISAKVADEKKSKKPLRISELDT